MRKKINHATNQDTFTGDVTLFTELKGGKGYDAIMNSMWFNIQ